jgi:acyl carrier protein
MQSIEQRVRAAVVDELGVTESEATPQAHLVDDLGADEFTRRELALRLNEEFGIRMSEEDIEMAATVADLIDRVRALAPQAGRPADMPAG